MADPGLRVCPGAFICRQGPGFLFLRGQDFCRHEPAVGTEEILLIVFQHARELRPVNHAQVIDRYAESDGNQSVNPFLDPLTGKRIAYGGIDAPGCAGDLFPQRCISSRRAVEFEAAADQVVYY